jgi:hypothetical protein
MDRRHSPRIEVQLPVQVWGMDAYGQPFTNAALVINLSADGLVLQGVARRVRVGEVLDIRMGADKAQFRVIWVGASGDLGMQKLTSTGTFLPGSVLVHCAQAAAAC